MTARPITWQWNGEAMVPLARFHNYVNAEFVVGELYRLTPVEERSMRSHRHFFASLHDAWLSLPDNLAVQFPTSEHLRKHALIMSGYRKERKLALSSAEEARKVAAFLRPQDGEDYAIISVNGSIVVEWTAMSQSVREMKGPTFQKSKADVLGFVADLIGVEKAALERTEAA